MEQTSPAVLGPVEPTVRHHEWDDDGCCIHCGFDGAEWSHWVNNVYGALNSLHNKPKTPPCEEHK